MGWSIHTAPDTGLLVEALARTLAVAPADPFTAEVVAVPTPGIERFLVQRLAAEFGASSAGDGVCANVRFPSPAQVAGDVLAAGSGLTVQEDPWAPGRLAWHVLAAIEASMSQGWAGPLRHHLRETSDRPRGDRRLALAAGVADLFAGYAAQRPALSLAWAAGRAEDGAGSPLPERLRWQFELWRVVRDAVGVADRGERLAEVTARLRAGELDLDLPERLSLFGPTRIPADQLACFTALAWSRDVVVYVADASGARWAALTGHAVPRHVPGRARGAAVDVVGSVSAGVPGALRRDLVEAQIRAQVGHPLLRSLGRDSAEMQLRLQAEGPATVVGHHHPAAGRHLLGWLRDDIAADTVASGGRVLGPGDRSVRVHACHGRPRQVEVLREELLHTLAADPTLQPRDILVMCPDLAGFAPLVTAVLGTAEQPVDSRAAGLRVQVADRSPSLSNSVLVVLEAMLVLLAGRVTANELLDFVALPAVATRLRADDEAMARLRQLAVAAGARWGLHPAHRSTLGLPEVAANTWQAAVDRMLLGVAMSTDGLPTIGRVLPLDEVGSGDAQLVGRFAELFAVLCQAWDALQSARPLAEWIGLLQGWLDAACEPPAEQRWDAPAAAAVLNGLVDDAGPGADTLRLDAAELRLLISERLAGMRPRSRFRAGGVTVSGLLPMRSVPYRVVVLLGLDDGVFPRQTVASGDDVLALEPLLGERDPASEDRQLLLDAVMAAGDRLVITYSGADPRTNEDRPPAVPLAELLDALDATATLPGGRVRDQVLVRHPLQPTDEANFIPGRLGEPDAFSHDPTARRGAQALRGTPTPVPTLAGAAATTPVVAEVTLAQLARFWRHPVQGFLRDGLGLTASTWDDAACDDLALHADALQAWALGNELLGWLEQGEDPTRAWTAALLSGHAPVGQAGVAAVNAQITTAQRIHLEAAARRVGAARTVPVDHHLPGGPRIVGTVVGLYDTGLVRTTFSKAKPKHRLPIYLDLLALAAATGQQPTAWLVHSGGVERLTLADTADQAAARLSRLAQTYAQGLARPLPLPLESSWTWHTHPHLTGPRRVAKTAVTWSKSPGGDQYDAAHVRVWGVGAPFEAIHAPAAPGAPGVSWFEDLAALLWGGLLIGAPS